MSLRPQAPGPWRFSLRALDGSGSASPSCAASSPAWAGGGVGGRWTVEVFLGPACTVDCEAGAVAIAGFTRAGSGDGGLTRAGASPLLTQGCTLATPACSLFMFTSTGSPPHISTITTSTLQARKGAARRGRRQHARCGGIAAAGADEVQMARFVHLQTGTMGRLPSLAPADQGLLTTARRCSFSDEMRCNPRQVACPSPPTARSTTLSLPIARHEQLSGCSLCTCISAPV